MHKGDTIELQIIEQGGPRINLGWVERAGAGVVALGVDMQSKRCSVNGSGMSDGSPMLMLSGEGALHLVKGLEDKWTLLALPQFAGWNIWSAEISRYTLSICLVRDALPALNGLADEAELRTCSKCGDTFDLSPCDLCAVCLLTTRIAHETTAMTEPTINARDVASSALLWDALAGHLHAAINETETLSACYDLHRSAAMITLQSQLERMRKIAEEARSQSEKADRSEPANPRSGPS
jgi:hypothetical protein